MRHLWPLLVILGLMLGSGCSLQNTSTAKNKTDDTVPADSFVRVDGKQFVLQGKPYRYVGTNLWYAAYLGSTESDIGDRQRLQKELDLLSRNGINNLRLLGASERSPLENSMTPAISYRGEVEREDILVGLDYALAEMARRNMKAVIFLNNFWEWSGGMGTYLSWVNNGEYIDMGDPKHPWPAFALFSATFYSNNDAVDLYYAYITKLLERKNTITGVLYKNDPTIMAWQLANEPRPGDGETSIDNLTNYNRWIENTAQMIKAHAPNQLVSIGSEGTMGCLGIEKCFLDAHKLEGIDYATFHMWPKNWGWFDVQKPEQTFPRVLKRAGNYIDEHIEMATELNMPLVLEEFGLERDMGAFAPGSSVTYRNQFFEFIFSRITASATAGGPLVGSNFWAWGGYGKALHSDAHWRSGDKSYVGDPPQEPQGLNSVFAQDKATLKLLHNHYKAMNTNF